MSVSLLDTDVLSRGTPPACVQACPEEAIRIEVVNVAAWCQQIEESAHAHDPWLERENPVHPTQFVQIEAMEGTPS